MQVVYSKKYFKIYRVDNTNDYIIHNTKKDFKSGHTHIRNYGTAKYILNLAFHKSIPKKHINNYLLNSIIRISLDESYIAKIRELVT